MGDLMDQQKWMNVAVIESPTLPLSPSHPKPVRDLSARHALRPDPRRPRGLLRGERSPAPSPPPKTSRLSPGFPVVAVVPLGPDQPRAPCKEPYRHLVSHSEQESL